MPRRKSQDALALLKADHQAVQQLFAEYAELLKDGDGDLTEKQDLAMRICAELAVHAQIEEELFYPAMRKALDEHDLLDEAEVEHAIAKELVTQLQEMEADDDLFNAKVTVLGEYVAHHIREEQGEMFKKARKAAMDLDTLGEEMRLRQTELKSELGIDDGDAAADGGTNDTLYDDEEEDPGPRHSHGSRAA